jgi:hypothetical protein
VQSEVKNNELPSRPISQRLYKIVCETLERHGRPIEIGRLESLALLRAEKEGKALNAGGKRLYAQAATAESDLIVSEYPSYRMKSLSRLPEFHDVKRGVKYTAAAAKVLLSSKDYVDLMDIIEEIEKKKIYTFPVPYPEYWMYHYLNGYGEIFSRKGDLKIGLRQWENASTPSKPVKKQASDGDRKSRRKGDSSDDIMPNMLEANLESIVAANLDKIEEGLRLLKRQFVCPGVGRIDLLCEDKRNNLVVIELKKFGADQNSVIDQIARYIGYVKTHLAKPRQKVRGIILVAKVDEKLRYAVAAFPSIEIKTFNLSIA